MIDLPSLATGALLGSYITLVLSAMWDSRRHALAKPSEVDDEILAAETTVYAPPSYGLRLIKK